MKRFVFHKQSNTDATASHVNASPGISANMCKELDHMGALYFYWFVHWISGFEFEYQGFDDTICNLVLGYIWTWPISKRWEAISMEWRAKSMLHNVIFKTCVSGSWTYCRIQENASLLSHRTSLIIFAHSYETKMLLVLQAHLWYVCVYTYIIHIFESDRGSCSSDSFSCKC